jgi:hypothetical protein
MTLVVNGKIKEKSEAMKAVEIFLPRFVLEVLGAAGAIWGASEAIGLRNSQNVWFWRTVALTFGFIFLLRWVKQIRDFIVAEEEEEGEEEELNSLVLQATLEERGRTV